MIDSNNNKNNNNIKHQKIYKNKYNFNNDNKSTITNDTFDTYKSKMILTSFSIENPFCINEHHFKNNFNEYVHNNILEEETKTENSPYSIEIEDQRFFNSSPNMSEIYFERNQDLNLEIESISDFQSKFIIQK